LATVTSLAFSEVNEIRIVTNKIFFITIIFLIKLITKINLIYQFKFNTIIVVIYNINSTDNYLQLNGKI